MASLRLGLWIKTMIRYRCRCGGLAERVFIGIVYKYVCNSCGSVYDISDAYYGMEKVIEGG